MKTLSLIISKQLLYSSNSPIIEHCKDCLALALALAEGPSQFTWGGECGGGREGDSQLFLQLCYHGDASEWRSEVYFKHLREVI